MPTKYSPASEDVQQRVESLIAKYYPKIAEAGVTIELLFATSGEEGGKPLKVGGWPAEACIRAVSGKDRAKGMKDVEMCIDEEHFEELSSEEKDALLDHELYHVVVQYDENEALKTDAYGRPKIGMRKHDYQVGHFVEVAQRHGQASAEVRQMRSIYDTHGQAIFGFINELRLVTSDEPAPAKSRRRTKVDEREAAA